jgi:integrase
MAMYDQQLTKIAPGIFKTSDGKWILRAAVKVAGQVLNTRAVLPASTPLSEAAAHLEGLTAHLRDPSLPKPASRPIEVQDLPQTPTHLPQTTGLTVADYAESWLSRKRKLLKDSAIVTYEINLSRHILPRIGHLQISSVTRGAIEAWVGWAQQQVQPAKLRSGRFKVVKGERVETEYDNSHAGELYSHDTMRQWWRVLSCFLKDMAADHAIPDPTLRVAPPARPQQNPKREQRTLDRDLTADLLDAARIHTPDRYAEITTLALTGMRAGEVFGLKWDSVDLAKREITVRRSVSGRKLSETTKTKTIRTVPMHQLVVDALTLHRRQQLEAQVEPVLSSGLVFPTQAGGVRDGNSLDAAYETLSKVLGGDLNLGSQVLRRSVNSNLVREGVDRLVIRSIVGHTSEQMTARYFGVNEAEKHAAVRRIQGGRKGSEVVTQQTVGDNLNTLGDNPG